ncbi:cytochrome P450 [Streptomyces sp. NPDC003016]
MTRTTGRARRAGRAGRAGHAAGAGQAAGAGRHASVPAPAPARASGRDTARLVVRAALPMLLEGGGVGSSATVRRRQGLALAARLDTDRRTVELLNGLRARYGPGPLRLRLAGRDIALPLRAEDADRVLARTPEPFSPAVREKHGPLGGVRPHGVPFSTGPERGGRRAFSEEVLETGHPLHRLAPRFVRIVREEADGLLGSTGAHAGRLDQDAFGAAWWRVVRRVLLGDAARDDTALTGRPGRPGRLRAYLDRAEPGSLAGAWERASAGASARAPAGPGTGPADQVTHWLSAFDAAGTAAVRALALLATHPAQEQQVHNELALPDLSRPQLLPYTRACVLESVRLWPTTPFLLRESTRPTRWSEGATVPAGTVFLVYAPFFHRDGSVPYGDRFVPEIWLDGTAHTGPALVPFGSGPGGCPGQDLALLVTSTLVAALMERHGFWLHGPARLRPGRPLPYTLDHFALCFTVTARHGGSGAR